MAQKRQKIDLGWLTDVGGLPVEKSNIRYKLPRLPVFSNRMVAVRSLLRTASISTSRKKFTVGFLQPTYDRLRMLRNIQFELLAASGFELGDRGSLSESDLVANIKTCPVVGLTEQRYGTSLFYCSLIRLCPFCWNRRITPDVYRRALYAWRPRRRDQAYLLDLPATVISRTDSVLTRGYDSDSFQKSFSRLVAESPAQVLKSALPKFLNGYGMVDIWHTGSTLTRLTRFLLFGSTAANYDPEPNVQIQSWHPSKRNIMEASIEAAYFPLELISSPAAGVQAVLRGLQNVPHRRLRASYGSFRKIPKRR
jgi:hypothetical protein